MASDPVLLEAALDAAVATPRFHALVIVVFAAAGLLLAAVGVAGTAGREVIGRTREIGIRLALGAVPRRVVWQIVRQGLVATVAGLTFGLAGAAALGTVLSAMLFELAPRDPTTLGGSVLLLLVVATLARYLPARKAARVDPTTALRCD